MPRRSGGGARSGSRPAPRPAPRPVHNAPPPQPAQHAPPPAPMQSSGGGSMLGGLGATIAQGMAFGTGSAVAHRAVDGIMGPRSVTHEHVNADSPISAARGATDLSTVSGADACTNQTKAFQDCINAYGSDIGKCQFYIDLLNECRHGSSSVTL